MSGVLVLTLFEGGASWKAVEVDPQTRRATDVTDEFECRQIAMDFEDGPRIGVFFGRRMNEIEAATHQAHVAAMPQEWPHGCAPDDSVPQQVADAGAEVTLELLEGRDQRRDEQLPALENGDDGMT